MRNPVWEDVARNVVGQFMKRPGPVAKVAGLLGAGMIARALPWVFVGWTVTKTITEIIQDWND